MSQTLFSISTWLHEVATVVFIGHYLLLALIYILRSSRALPYSI